MSQAVRQSLYAVLQPCNIEIYEEPQTLSAEFEVREQLSLMNCCQGIHRFDFNDHQILHKQIKTITNVEPDLSINEG